MLKTPEINLQETELQVQHLTLVWLVSGRVQNPTEVLQRYLAVLRELEISKDLLIVNRGIKDEVAHGLAEQTRAADIPASVMVSKGISPYSGALSSAFGCATGDAIAIMPEYLQVDPSCLVEMLKELDAGADYVATYRTRRVDRHRGRLRSRWFNYLVRGASGVKLTDVNSGLKMLRKELAESVPMHGELHVYLPVLAANQGYRVSEVAAAHLSERTGDKHLRLYLRRLLDLLTLFFLMRFTRKPFRFFGGVGSVSFLTGATINSVLAFQRLVLDKSLADRPALVLGTLLMALGLQLFSLGLLGELIIFVQAGGLKDYKLHEVLDLRSASKRAEVVKETKTEC